MDTDFIAIKVEREVYPIPPIRTVIITLSKQGVDEILAAYPEQVGCNNSKSRDRKSVV